MLEVRIAAMRCECGKHARMQHHQVHRPVAARRFSKNGAAAFLRYGSIRGIDVSDDIADRVGGVGAIVYGIHVLRSAQPREAVDDHEQRRRHAALGDQPVGPLHDVGFPWSRREEGSHVAGVAVQAIQDGISS